MNPNKQIEARAVRKTKVETTYEYQPILGEILGYWRKVDARRLGEDIELHIRTHLDQYDRLIINGKEIDITKE